MPDTRCGRGGDEPPTSETPILLSTQISEERVPDPQDDKPTPTGSPAEQLPLMSAPHSLLGTSPAPPLPQSMEPRHKVNAASHRMLRV